jgi:hypothetical protein
MDSALDRLLRRRAFAGAQQAAPGAATRLPELRMSVAAVVDQERDYRPHPLEFEPVDDGAAFAGRAEQAGPHQNGEMAGEGVVGRADFSAICPAVTTIGSCFIRSLTAASLLGWASAERAEIACASPTASPASMALAWLATARMDFRIETSPD